MRPRTRAYEEKKDCKREHDFALVIDGVPELTTEVENAFFEAGCDDATLSIQYGWLYAEFSRAAASLEDAILSAIRDVRKAKVGAVALRVDECDLVTPSEIARRIGRSRQLLFQYINGQRGPGNFPARCAILRRTIRFGRGARSVTGWRKTTLFARKRRGMRRWWRRSTTLWRGRGSVGGILCSRGILRKRLAWLRDVGRSKSEKVRSEK